MISDYFKLGYKNLSRRKLRSWLTMIGIFISIAIIFVLISLSLGFKSAITEHVRSLGTDKFFIYPSLSAGMPGASNPIKMSTGDVDAVKSVSGVKNVAYLSLENGRLEFEKHIKYAMVQGFPLEEDGLKEVLFESSNLKIDDGKIFDKGERGFVMLGYEYKYGKVFDKPLKAGDSIKINDISFKVKAILQSVGSSEDDKNVYMALEDMKEIFGTGDRVDSMIVQVQSGANLEDVAARAEKKLMSYRNVNEKTKDFDLATPEELLRSIQDVLNIITAFLLGVAAISLIVGAIGIANTMYTAVIERTREIGIMKAVGAKNSDILWIFLIESGMLGLVGGIIGVLLGIGIGETIEYIALNQLRQNLLQVVYPAWLIIGCLTFAFLAGAVSGTWPAWKASQVRPVQALRYE